MMRPSKASLIKFFKGQATELEIELIHLYLAMNKDTSYIEECLKEVLIDDSDPNHTDFNEERWLAFELKLKGKQEFLLSKPDHSAGNISSDRSDLRNKGGRIFNFRRTLWFCVAGLVTIFFTFLGLFHGKVFQSDRLDQNIANQKQDISNEITITLADGNQIPLSDLPNDTQINQGGSLIQKSSENEIHFLGTVHDMHAQNTIQTPAGKTTLLYLPDGTKAWLNGASSVTYPTQFNDQERLVLMEGEVYFEISKLRDKKGKSIPFRVSAEKQMVEVLGTKFNMRSFPDNGFSNISLIEGSVRVEAKATGKSVLLKPGQEANIDQDITVRDAIIDEVLAWKNGDFVFINKPLSEVLNELSRWYQVEVSCPKEFEHIRFSGMLAREKSLESVLESLSSTKSLTIKLKERRIVVGK